MSFSNQENPLDLQAAIDRQIKALKVEILLVHQSMDIKRANRSQLEVMGGLMNRHLKQIDLESKLNLEITKTAHDNPLEFLFIQKILILSKEFSEVDLKDFLAM